MSLVSNAFDLSGRRAVVTGGYGVLGGSMADGLAAAGAKVAVLGRRRDKAEAKVQELRALGAEAMVLTADVLDRAQLDAAREELVKAWGGVDILINAAGGNVQRARNDRSSIFDVPMDAFDEVMDLNLKGSIVPTMVFGELMTQQKRGTVINIASMASIRVLSGVLGYSVAKSGIDIFTRWMAVEMARKFGEGIRVNAIAPGFFVSEQNRAVMVKPDGSYTDRAQSVIAQTPMGRFGKPAELNGAIVFLSSDASAFVTGTVIPVDGGFSIFSGV